MMEKNAKIYVAGHRGMVGSAIVRELERQGYTNIINQNSQGAGSDQTGCSREVLCRREAGVCVPGCGQSGRYCGKRVRSC